VNQAASLPPIDNLLLQLAGDIRNPELLWQAGIVAVAAMLAWALMARLRPVLARASWKHGAAAARRIGFPLLMLLAVAAARLIATPLLQTAPHLLNLAVPLLTSLAGVRAAVFALRYAFRGGGVLKTSEHIVGWTIWGGFALHIIGVGSRIRATLEGLAFTAGTHTISLWLLAQAAVVIVGALVAALALSRFVEFRLMRMEQFNLSLRMAATKALRTVFVIIAVLIALPAVGIDLTVLSVFGGALGVGIGFGLQKIASNYISGFIILLDRSIRIGDMVTVDAKYGEVREINTRYTLLRSRDGTESLVPNEAFITNTVVNHSLTQPTVRLSLRVQVAYSTDLDRAREVMRAAAVHPRVVQDDPECPIRVYLMEFADNGIVLELRVWIRDADEGQNNLKSDLNWAIWEGFQAEGIEIPFPQRVVHMQPAPVQP